MAVAFSGDETNMVIDRTADITHNKWSKDEEAAR